ncbi:MAG TPA: hypothetical protein ENN46_02110 [Candidatus Woesearchaeota archaeon]|nr:hypothetical protein [Candidatus Woesearchaeota archaeon]
MKKNRGEGLRFNQTRMLVILIIILAVAFALYIALDKVPEIQKAKEDRISQVIFEETLDFLMDQTDDCGIAQIVFENKTRQIIGLECVEMVYIEGYRSAVEALFESSEGCAAVPVTLDNQTLFFIDQRCMID